MLTLARSHRSNIVNANQNLASCEDKPTENLLNLSRTSTWIDYSVYFLSTFHSLATRPIKDKIHSHNQNHKEKSLKELHPPKHTKRQRNFLQQSPRVYSKNSSQDTNDESLHVILNKHGMEMFKAETLFYIRVETTTSLTHRQTKKRQEKKRKALNQKIINFYTQHCKKNAILIPYFPQKNSIEITFSFKSFL